MNSPDRAPDRSAIALRAAAALLLCCLLSGAHAETVISAVRVWPASEYTRITLESAQPIEYNVFSAKNPERLVVDMEGVELGKQLRALPERIAADDPYIARARVAINRPGVVRLVFELKTEIKPQAFLLKPISEYSHRLVIDVYPAHASDPLLALVDELGKEGRDTGASRSIADELPPAPSSKAAEPVRSEGQAAPVEHEAKAKQAREAEPSKPAGKRKQRPQPEVVRLMTVAIDAGHGGEDPGARGRHGTFEKDVTLAIAGKLKARIDAEPNMRAVLTRDGDYFVALADRVNKARRVRADLF